MFPSRAAQVTKDDISTRPSWILRVWNDWYFVDLFCLALSICASLGLFALLHHFQGSSLPHWPWGVSLNTVVSFVAISSRALMLVCVGSSIGQLKWLWFNERGDALIHLQNFDSASRSPFGGIRLLLHLRAWHLGSLGVLLSAAALAMEPLAQQSISYPLRDLPSPAAFIPRSQFFHSGGGTAFLNDARDMKMRGAIVGGLYNQDLINAAITSSMSCLTGNCTFPAYSSMAVCSQCVNTTHLLTPVENVPTSCCTNPLSTDSCVCQLPNGNSMQQRRTEGMNVTMAALNTADLDHISPRLANISSIFTNGDTGAPLLAADCTLYLCVQAFSGTITEGVLHENITATYTPDFEPSGSDYSFSVPQSMLGPNESTNFTTYDAKTMYLSIWLPSYLEGNANNLDSVRAMYFTTIARNNGSLPTTIANLATSMTNDIRTKGYGVNGTAWQTETYVHVTWFWLIFPFGLQVLALVFFVATVTMSARAGLPVWRTSVLPILYNWEGRTLASRAELEVRDKPVPSSREAEVNPDLSVGSEYVSESRPLLRVSDMEELARRTRVRMRWSRGRGVLAEE